MDHVPAFNRAITEVLGSSPWAGPTATQNDATHETDVSSPGPAGVVETDHTPPLNCSINGPVAAHPTATHCEDVTHETDCNSPTTAGAVIADHTPPVNLSINWVPPSIVLVPTAIQEPGEVHDTPPRTAKSLSGKVGIVIGDHTPLLN
jgi:hypothetical protein